MCSLDNIETVHREKKFEKKKSGIPAKARKVASLSDINDFTDSHKSKLAIVGSNTLFSCKVSNSHLTINCCHNIHGVKSFC